MTAIETAIRDAVEKGGYKAFKHYGENYIQKLNESFVLLDPAFWQALGKARGWYKPCYYCGRDGSDCGEKVYPHEYRESTHYWKKYWHRFIDHLAEGKDAESFFASLQAASY